MAGKTKGILKEFVPTVHDVEAPSNVSAAVRSKKYGCLMPRYTDRVKGYASLGMTREVFGVCCLKSGQLCLKIWYLKEGSEVGSRSSQGARDTSCQKQRKILNAISYQRMIPQNSITN